MKTEMPELINNEAKKRYEIHFEDSVAFIEYIKTKENIYLTHTEVPKKLEGKGIGSAMVLATLKDVKDKGLILIPLCPFVALYIKRHPEWKELVLRGINIG